MPVRKGTRAIIVGGGIGGLSAAISLRQAGLEVAVFERMSALREIGAGLCCWTNAMRALQKLGVADAVRDRGGKIERFENRNTQGELLSTNPVGEIGRKYGAASYGIRRPELLSVLAGALDKEIVHLDSACVGFEQDETGVTVRFANGQEARGDLLIGADGRDSVVRQHLLGKSDPRYVGYMAWRAVTKFELDQFPPHTMVQWYGRGLMIGIFPVCPGMVNWYATRKAPEGGQDGPGGRKAEVLDAYRGWAEPIEGCLESTDERGINRVDLFDRRPDRRWTIGRVTLLGDAAHPMTIALGLGSCTAIEDAAVLGRCLAGADDVLSGLKKYEAERIPRAASIQVLAWRLGWQNHWEHSWACTARDEMMRHTPSGILTKILENVLGFEA
jgi:2-polyprenyl-6-methoxyphenol hydroxylase-like FAD-dependent oxidoreductase